MRASHCADLLGVGAMRVHAEALGAVGLLLCAVSLQMCHGELSDNFYNVVHDGVDAAMGEVASAYTCLLRFSD